MATYYWIEEDKYKEYMSANTFSRPVLWNVDDTIKKMKEKIEKVHKAFHSEDSLTEKTYLVATNLNRDRVDRPFRRYMYTRDKKINLIDKDYFV